MEDKLRQTIKVNLNATLKDVLSDLKMTIEESRAEITLDEMPVINTDSVQMHRLFLNLISKAIKFNDKDHPVINIYAHKRRDLWFKSQPGTGTTFYKVLHPLYSVMEINTGVPFQNNSWLINKPGDR